MTGVLLYDTSKVTILVARAKPTYKTERLKGCISKTIQSCNLECCMPSVDYTNQSNFRIFLGNIGDGHLEFFWSKLVESTRNDPHLFLK